MSGQTEIRLTAREREIVELVKTGAGYKKMAQLLGLSPHTVRNHVKAIARMIPGDAPPLRRILLWSMARSD